MDENRDAYIVKLIRSTKIRDVMIRDVVTVFENDDFSEVEEKFLKYSLTHIVVINRQGELTGLISQKYLYKTQSPRKIMSDEIKYNLNVIIDGDSYYSKDMLNGFVLKEMMKKDPFSLHPDDYILTAISNMAERRIGCIPIVDKHKKIKGIITDMDIVKFIGSIFEA